jgi:hypothetical protein
MVNYTTVNYTIDFGESSYGRALRNLICEPRR